MRVDQRKSCRKERSFGHIQKNEAVPVLEVGLQLTAALITS